MKISKLKSGLAVCALLLLVFATVMIGLSVSSQAQQQGGQSKTSGREEISWKSTRQTIQSLNGKIDLAIPNSVSAGNWIIGILPTNENETITAGIVRWQGESNSKKAVNWQLAQIIDYPQESLNLVQGRLDLTDTNNLNSAAGDSLVVLLRVAQGTEIRVLQNGQEISNNAVVGSEGMAINSGTSFGKIKVTGVSSLVTQLQTDRVVKGFGKNVKEVKIND